MSLFQKIFYFFVSLLCLRPNYAQHCGVDKHTSFLGNHYEKSLENLDELLLNSRLKKSNELITIPVVVHLMHTGSMIGEGVNLTDEAVDDAISGMNHAFRATGEFFEKTLDIKVQFQLALRDENDQPTSGINRIDAGGVLSYVTNGETINAETRIKNLISWDNSSYLNIWVVNKIDDPSATVAYATLPIEGAFDYVGTEDGITVQASSFNTAVLAHEAGHYLGLYHTFAGSSGSDCPFEQNCLLDGDKICDTEPHKANDQCAAFSDFDINICTGTPYGKVLDNFMSYGGYACSGLFTEGQKQRMRSVFEISNRKALLSSTGLVPAASPKAAFEIESKVSCLGSTIVFQDQSLDGPTSWNWTFEGGLPGTSTLQSPSVTYSTSGLHKVTLTVSNSLGTSNVSEQFLSVYPSAAAPECVNSSSEALNRYGTGIKELWWNEEMRSSGDTNDDALNFGQGGYVDGACSNVFKVQSGSENIIKLVVGSLNPEQAVLYIDWDNNGSFGEEELVHRFSGFTGESSFSLKVPGVLENYNQILRIRVVSDFSWKPPLNSCSIPQGGQVEDFGLVVVPLEEPPVARFYASDTIFGCPNVTFSNESVGSPTSWLWSFPGGIPSTSTELNPIVSYGAEGSYSVTLAVSNAYGVDELIKTDYVEVVKSLEEVGCTSLTSNLNNFFQFGIKEVKLGAAVYSSGYTVEDEATYGTSGYLDRTCDVPVIVTSDSVLNSYVVVGEVNPANIAVYVDWNNDGDFEEIDEQVVFVSGIKGKHTFNLEVPKGFDNFGSLLRVRVITDANSLFPCINPQYGQVEDYSLIVTNEDLISSESTSFEKSMLIFPNPAEDAVTLKGNLLPQKVLVFNSIGQTVISRDVVNSTINCTEFSNGIYYFTLIWSDRTETHSVLFK